MEKFKELTWYKNFSTTSEYAEAIRFAFVVRENNEKYVQRSLNAHYCRETMIGRVHDQLIAGYDSGIDFSMLTLLTFFRHPIRSSRPGWWPKSIERAIKVINALEDRAGWPKSTVRTLDNQDQPNQPLVFLFEGSKKWLHASPLLSLYMLCIRLGRLGGFDNFEFTLESMNRINKTLPPDDDDSAHFRNTYPYWDLILRNADRLFLCRNIEANYRSPYDGILKLVAGNVSVLSINRAWSKLMSEEEMRKSNENS